MQYMLLCCIDEREWNGLPPGRRDAVMHDYRAFVDDLVAQGAYVTGGKLQDSITATTVRSSQGRVVFTDGPFAETKEQLGGFHIVDCPDLDAALAIARRIPTLPVGGTIEVRPLDHTLGAPAAADSAAAALSISAPAVRPVDVGTTTTEDA
jgi:hypothetical protein